MSVALLYAACVIAPAVAFWIARTGVDRFAAAHRTRRAAPCASGRPLQLLVKDLGRLERDLQDLTARLDASARVSRLHAVSLAYDDTLRACCRALGLPEPRDPPLDPLLRLQAEADLAQHGLVW